MADTNDSPRREIADANDDTQTAEEESTGIPHEVMENLPPEARKQITSMLAMRSIGPLPNPVLAKVTPEHISRILDISEQDSERSFKDAQHARLFTAFYVLLFVIALGTLVWYLVPMDKALFLDVFKVFVAFAGDFGSGFGIRSRIDRRSAS
jgi:hypothetical protein